jgi:hypothetical protein
MHKVIPQEILKILEQKLKSKLVVQPGTHCWIYQGHIMVKGYGSISHQFYQILTHRLAWQIAHGPIPKKMYVCHHCDNRPCCNPEHLFLGTAQDNIDDMIAKGRMKRAFGEEHHSARLSNYNVIWIREVFIHGSERFGSKALAKKFNVTETAIRKIILRKTWKHVDADE